MPSISKRIRDIERAIKKKDAGDQNAEALKKLLSHLYEEKNVRESKEKEKKNAVKYHYLKFIERQKLCRKIRALDTKFKQKVSNTSKDEYNLQRQSLLRDLTYVLYFPNDEKYIGTTSNLVTNVLFALICKF